MSVTTIPTVAEILPFEHSLLVFLARHLRVIWKEMLTSSVVARRKTLFDDRPEEINQLTFIIKQDLAALTHQISHLLEQNRSQHPSASKQDSPDQEGRHNENVRAFTPSTWRNLLFQDTDLSRLRSCLRSMTDVRQ